MASLNGRLCIAGRAGRQPAFARTDQWAEWTPPPAAIARAELVRRYLSAYGPSTPAHLAQWAGIGNAHARELLGAVADELSDAAGGKLLTRDLEAFEHPPPATGVRLIAPGDPLLLGRDRESLLPDAEARKRVWRAIGGAGVVLAEGEPVATWRARKQGRRLELTIEPIAGASAQPLAEALQAEADRLAPHRGATSAVLAYQ